MEKWKSIAIQTLFISVSIFTFIGLKLVVYHLSTGETTFAMSWYLPLSIILTSALCSLTSLILYQDKKLKLYHYLLHYACIGGIVLIAGWIFEWYHGLAGMFWMLVNFSVIYGLTWLVMFWLSAVEIKKINEALDAMRDEE